MKRLPIHPLCAAFPDMSDEEYAALKADMKENGQREPITIHEGQILDGRNRYRCAMELKIKPKTRKWDEKGSIVAFVVGMNINRRHLDASQRAMIAAELSTLLPGEKKADTPSGVSQADAAQAMGTSVRAISRANVVKEDGAEELVNAVKSGDVPVSLAAQAARSLPTAAQVKALRDADRKGTEPAAELREAVKKAEPKKSPKPGAEKFGPAQRKEAKALFGKLTRLCTRAGIYESLLPHFNAILKAIEK